MNYNKKIIYLFTILFINCSKNKSYIIDTSKYYIYSKASGNNIDYFFRVGSDSFCYDFTNSKIYTNFSHKVITAFRNEIVENNPPFVIGSNEIDLFSIDSVVYYSYSKNGLTNIIFSKNNISEIRYDFKSLTIDTTIYKTNKNKYKNFKLVVLFLKKTLKKSPLYLDSNDRIQKPITDLFFYKVKNEAWECFTIPYNSSYLNFFKTLLPI